MDSNLLDFDLDELMSGDDKTYWFINPNDGTRGIINADDKVAAKAEIRADYGCDVAEDDIHEWNTEEVLESAK